MRLDVVVAPSVLGGSEDKVVKGGLGANFIDMERGGGGGGGGCSNEWTGASSSGLEMRLTMRR